MKRVLMFVLFGGFVLASFSLGFAATPGPESTEPKDETLSEWYLHNLEGTHTVKRYYDYPLNWPECYQETEVGYDAKDEATVFCGPWNRYNPTCAIDTLEETHTKQGSVTVTLGGSHTSSIKAELGWPGVGTMSMGTETTLSWELSGTYTATHSVKTKDIPANQCHWWFKDYKLVKRQGSEYDYVEGWGAMYCTTHYVWVGVADKPYLVDYDGEINRATVEYENDDGIAHYFHWVPDTECDHTYTRPDVERTFPGDPSYQAGARWYDLS